MGHAYAQIELSNHRRPQLRPLRGHRTPSP
jgi:hypothetical protein